MSHGKLARNLEAREKSFSNSWKDGAWLFFPLSYGADQKTIKKTFKRLYEAMRKLIKTT